MRAKNLAQRCLLRELAHATCEEQHAERTCYYNSAEELAWKFAQRTLCRATCSVKRASRTSSENRLRSCSCVALWGHALPYNSVNYAFGPPVFWFQGTPTKKTGFRVQPAKKEYFQTKKTQVGCFSNRNRSLEAVSYPLLSLHYQHGNQLAFLQPVFSWPTNSTKSFAIRPTKNQPAFG